MGSARVLKNSLLNAWKCTQMKLYLYCLIIGAPGGGRVVPAILKLAFKCIEMYSDDIVILLFKHKSPR